MTNTSSSPRLTSSRLRTAGTLARITVNGVRHNKTSDRPKKMLVVFMSDGKHSGTTEFKQNARRVIVSVNLYLSLSPFFYVSSLLSTNAPLSSDISLVIQVAIILILSAAVYRAKDRFFLQHAYLMLACTILNTVSVALVMVPVAWALVRGVALSGFLVFVLVHAVIGITVLAVSYYLMWVWRLDKPGPCFKHKNEMRLLIVAWFAEVVAGIAVYYLLYL